MPSFCNRQIEYLHVFAKWEILSFSSKARLTGIPSAMSSSFEIATFHGLLCANRTYLLAYWHCIMEGPFKMDLTEYLFVSFRVSKRNSNWVLQFSLNKVGTYFSTDLTNFICLLDTYMDIILIEYTSTSITIGLVIRHF